MMYNEAGHRNTPGQQPVYELPLLLAVAWPVPPHVLVEVVPQQVAAFFGVHFRHLKHTNIQQLSIESQRFVGIK